MEPKLHIISLMMVRESACLFACLLAFVCSLFVLRQLAEDRIPSYLACFFGPKAQPLNTHWVRDAVFYFEAELELCSLVRQRRRWLNGKHAAARHAHPCPHTPGAGGADRAYVRMTPPWL